MSANASSIVENGVDASPSRPRPLRHLPLARFDAIAGVDDARHLDGKGPARKALLARAFAAPAFLYRLCRRIPASIPLLPLLPEHEHEHERILATTDCGDMRREMLTRRDSSCDGDGDGDAHFTDE